MHIYTYMYIHVCENTCMCFVVDVHGICTYEFELFRNICKFFLPNFILYGSIRVYMYMYIHAHILVCTLNQKMGCFLLQGTSILGNLGMGWSGTEEAWPQSPQTKEAWSDGRGGCVGPAT